MITLFSFAPFSHSAQAGPEPFIGEMMMFAGNFCPRGWTDASGQLLDVNQYQALFLGTTYGGDGRTNFGMPDMRGRAAIHAGHGLRLTNRTLGSKSGTKREALSVSQMPSHSHSLNASNISATSKTPEGKVQAKTRRKSYASAGSGGLTQMPLNPWGQWVTGSLTIICSLI